MNFSIGRRLRASNDLFWAQECVLTHSVERSKWLEELASESNTIQAQRYISVREDCRPRPAETMCRKSMVICQYLWIDQFVWARVVCGPRKHQSASVDCSGVI